MFSNESIRRYEQSEWERCLLVLGQLIAKVR